jgi:hypothetical protein
MGKTRLDLIITNLVVSPHTLGTCAAATDKGKGYSITNLPPDNMFPDRFNAPGNFMSGHVGQRDIWIMSHPSMPVAAA